MDDSSSPSPEHRVLIMGSENRGSITKRISQKQNSKQCEDRISYLPSKVIGHILSFLPTKNAVATSALSTTWKKFWTLINSVDLDDKLWRCRRESNSSSLPQLSLTSFLYRVPHRVSCLHKFRVKFSQRYYDGSDVNALITAILKHPIQELDLSIPMENSTHVLPQDMFSCRTLVVLKLGIVCVMNVPASVSLPSLKVLHLDTVKFLDDDSIKRLLLGCPVLDELSMNECVRKDVRVVHICAPSLTKLRYSFFPYNSIRSTEVTGCKIVIDTPALQHLELYHYVAEVHLVKDLCHIVKAEISSEHAPSAVFDLLKRASEVQCLHLYHFSDEAIHNFDPQLPMFRNLTDLVIGVGYIGWEWLLLLLEKSPHLQTLVFGQGHEDIDVYDAEGNPLGRHPPQNVPACLLLHLKVIKFVDFPWTEIDLAMVEYFLKNAEVLEKMIVHSEEEEVELMNKLLTLPRSSRTCQVEHTVLYPDYT